MNLVLEETNKQYQVLGSVGMAQKMAQKDGTEDFVMTEGRSETKTNKLEKICGFFLSL